MTINGNTKPSTREIMHGDPGLSDIIVIDQLPPETWAEGIVIRPNGDAIVARLNEPEIYSIKRTSNSAAAAFDGSEAKPLYTFPDATGAFNVAPLISSTREEYAVVTGYIDIPEAQFHNFAVWRVSYARETADDETVAPEVTKIADLPDGRFCVGMIPISERTLLLADASAGIIYRIDVPTGNTSIFYEDECLRPGSKHEFLGGNRIRIRNGYLYITNTSTGVLFRVRVEETEDGQDLKDAIGPMDYVADGLSFADGMVMTRDGSAAYVASYVPGTLFRVDIDQEAGTGVSNLVCQSLGSPTAMDLVYDENDKDAKPTLYLVGNGAIGMKWLQEKGSEWLSLVNIDLSKALVMKTVETVISYEPNPDYKPPAEEV